MLRRGQRRWWFALFIGASSLIAYVLSYLLQIALSLFSDQPLDAQVKIITAGVVSSLVYALIQEIRVFPQLREEYLTAAKPLFEALLVLALHFTTDDRTARASIFLPDRNNKLYNYVRTAGFDPREADLRFEKRQGVVGHIWSKPDHKTAYYGDLEGITDDELDQTWKLTPEQIELTRHITGILVVNLRFEGKIIGVLSIDSQDPQYKRHYLSPDTADRAVEVASWIVRSLRP